MANKHALVLSCISGSSYMDDHIPLWDAKYVDGLCYHDAAHWDIMALHNSSSFIKPRHRATPNLLTTSGYYKSHLYLLIYTSRFWYLMIWFCRLLSTLIKVWNKKKAPSPPSLSQYGELFQNMAHGFEIGGPGGVRSTVTTIRQNRVIFFCNSIMRPTLSWGLRREYLDCLRWITSFYWLPWCKCD